MSSRSFVLAYACDRADPLSPEELNFRIAVSSEHVASLNRAEMNVSRVGNGRTGFVVWCPEGYGSSWPTASSGKDEGAAWVHIPAAAGGADSGVDPVRLARDITRGRVDRMEMGAPAAAIYWSRHGLRIANDRLGMVRLYQFEVPDFGVVWSTRPGLGHVFGGLTPVVEQSTWSEIATLGWNISGRAHLGNGRQLLASTTITANNHGAVETSNDRDEWIQSTATGDVPGYADAARGMVDAMATLSWWKHKPLADLSGGKDSRVTAAAAIHAGVVDVVRTTNTDAGEVETARNLLNLAGNPVDHRVIELKPPKEPEGGVYARYLAAQRAWEGGYSAISAHRGSLIARFGVTSTPTINGLGGEAIQGQTMAAAAVRQQLESQNADAGHEWLYRSIALNLGIIDAERAEPARYAIDSFVDTARSLGLTTAFQMIDFFYHFSKMPYWSHPQINPGALLPFYSPKMLPRTMWTLFHPAKEYGRVHRELLKMILPVWSKVPFYKGSAKTRSMPWMWENDDWVDFKDVIRDGVGSLQSFVPREVERFIQAADSGQGASRHEVGLARVMWELSFREFAEEIAEAARRTVEGVTAIRHRNVRDS